MGYWWNGSNFKKNVTFHAGLHLPDNQILSFGTPIPATADLTMRSDGTRPEIVNLSGQDVHFRHGGLVVFRYNGTELRLTDNIYGSRGTGGFITDYGEKYNGTNYERNLISGTEIWEANSINKIFTSSSQRNLSDNYYLAFGSSGYINDHGFKYTGTNFEENLISGEDIKYHNSGEIWRWNTEGIEMVSTLAYYFGDAATNNTWRIKREGNNLVFQRREAGAYVTKSTMVP